MVFLIETAAKAAFKKLYGRAHTTNTKDIVNEGLGSSLSIGGQSIFCDRIPQDPLEAVVDGLAVFSEVRLELDASSGGKAYIAKLGGVVPAGLIGKISPLTGFAYEPGDRVGGFIPDYISPNYRIILRDGSTEVPPLAAQDWVFDYFAGIVTSEDNLNLADGYVDGYLYIGEYLSETGSGWLRNGENIENRNDGYVDVITSLRVTNRIGVSTDSPSESLEVLNGNLLVRNESDAIGGYSRIQVHGTPHSDGPIGSLEFKNENSTSLNKVIAEVRGYPATSNGGSLQLRTATTSGFLLTVATLNDLGNLGIGTVAPTSPIHIRSGTSAAANIQIDYNNTAWTTGLTIGSLLWSGNDASAGAGGTRARISAITEDGVGKTRLAFLTTNSSSTTQNEVMTISGSARVGIGTDNPSEKLHVANGTTLISDSGGRGTLTLDGSAGGEIRNLNGSLNFFIGGISRARVSILGNWGFGVLEPTEKLHVDGNIHLTGGTGREIYHRDAHPLLFGTSDTERVRITSTGDVGIGLTVPNERLQVAGNIHVSGGDRTIFNRSNNYLALGTNNAERVRITSLGRVGIGGSFPVRKLEVWEPANPGAHTVCGLFSQSSAEDNSSVGVRLQASPSPDSWACAEIVGQRTNSPVAGSNRMIFRIGLNSGDVSSATPSDILTLNPNLSHSLRGSLAITNSLSAFGAFMVDVFSDTITLNSATSGTGAVVRRNTTTGLLRPETSDRRLKRDIRTIDGALDSVRKLQGRTFKRHDDGSGAFAHAPGEEDMEHLGFIAQEVEVIEPRLVQNVGIKDYKAVHYDKITALLVEAIKELSDKIIYMENQLNIKK